MATMLKSLEGFFGKGGMSITHVIIVAVAIVLAIALFRGACAASGMRDGLTPGNLQPAAYPGAQAGPTGPAPAGALNEGVATATAVAPGTVSGPDVAASPDQLKPQNALKVNWLRPPLLSQNPLRNANRTVREDPLIPKVDVGPFLNSTIDQSDRPGLTTCEAPSQGPGPMAAASSTPFADSYAAL